MRIALDNTALVAITENTSLTKRVLAKLHKGEWTELVVSRQVSEEFQIRSSKQSRNYESLLSFIHQDKVHYFTVGESQVGGADLIAPNTLLDITGDLSSPLQQYERYKKTQLVSGLTPKDSRRWLNKNKHQSDAIIYARAVDTRCDVLVTNDATLRKRIVQHGSKVQATTLEALLGGDA